MMTNGRDNGKPYCNGQIAATMQALADKTVSGKFVSVNFEIGQCQILDDIVSSLRYLIKVTETSPDTD